MSEDLYSLRDAALALHKGLAEVGAIDAERGRWEWGGMPLSVERDLDRAVASIRAAVRYLYTETD